MKISVPLILRKQTNYANHLITENHIVDKNFKIIDVGRKGRLRNRLEFAAINSHKSSDLLLKEQIDNSNSPLLNLFPARPDT